MDNGVDNGGRGNTCDGAEDALVDGAEDVIVVSDAVSVSFKLCLISDAVDVLYIEDDKGGLPIYSKFISFINSCEMWG